jgi:hypothetical protein
VAGGAGAAQRLIQAPEPPAEDPGVESVSENSLAIGGRTLACTVVTRRSEDLEGRISESVRIWSREVPPLYAGSAHGGLVRRLAPAPGVELLRWGSDAKPSLAR